MDVVYNGGNAVTIILDNRTTAMTGGQENPGTGHTLAGAEAPALDLAEFCRALGVPRVEVVDPYDLKEVQRAVTEAIAAPGAERHRGPGPLRLAVPTARRSLGGGRRGLHGLQALSARGLHRPQPGSGGGRSDEKGKVAIDATLCTGCGICAQMCRLDAIGPRVAAPVGA